jgi:hypothetical protein
MLFKVQRHCLNINKNQCISRDFSYNNNFTSQNKAQASSIDFSFFGFASKGTLAKDVCDFFMEKTLVCVVFECKGIRIFVNFYYLNQFYKENLTFNKNSVDKIISVIIIIFHEFVFFVIFREINAN